MPELTKGEDLAIILSNQPAQSAGLVVTMLTLHGGKVSCLASGIRRGHARLCGTVEPLNLVAARIQGDNPTTLRDARVLSDFSEIKSNWKASQKALAAAWNVSILTGPGDPQPRLFGILLNALLAIPTHQENGFLPRFNTRLLAETGYRPLLDHCVACSGPLLPVKHYNYAMGGPTCASCPAPEPGAGHRISEPDLQELRALIKGQTPPEGTLAPSIMERSVLWSAA